MDEREWLNCDDITWMLIYVRGEVEPALAEPDHRPRLLTRRGPLVYGDGARVSRRQLSSFAQECCRRWWDLPLDEASRHLVLCYEQFLAEESTWDEFVSARSHLLDVARSGAKPLINMMCLWDLNPYGMAQLEEDLAWVTAYHLHRERIEELERTASEDERIAWGFFGYDCPEFRATANAVRQGLPALLREVVGNPFRPLPHLAPQVLQWNNGTVKRLAEQAYEQRLLPSGHLDNARLAVLADALLDAGCTDPEILGHLREAGPHWRGCFVLDLLLGKS